MKDDFSQGQSPSIERLAKSARAFTSDYIDRHRDPVNAALHIVGVPAVLYGIFCAVTGRSNKQRSVGLVFVVFGYFLQYLGHKNQGNEVGEVSLIKYLIVKMRQASRRRMRSYNWFGSDQGDGQGSNQASATAGAGKAPGANGNGNGNGNNGGGGGNGHSSGSGRYILWWKTSH
jgi:hypothetical protein